MSLTSKEHYDLIAQFDRDNSSERLDKEQKDLWNIGAVYKDGKVNSLFIAFRDGYSFAKHLSI